MRSRQARSSPARSGSGCARSPAVRTSPRRGCQRWVARCGWPRGPPGWSLTWTLAPWPPACMKPSATSPPPRSANPARSPCRPASARYMVCAGVPGRHRAGQTHRAEAVAGCAPCGTSPRRDAGFGRKAPRNRHALRSVSPENGPVIYRFMVGRLSCAVSSDGQLRPPWEPPLASFFTPAGVPEHELHAALAAEGRARTTLSCGYNCVLVQTSHGHAVIDTGLGARFLGYGPPIEPLVGRLGDGLASAGAPAAELAAVVFTHLHQDHCRGATWSGELTFPQATGFAHAAEVAFWSGAQAASAADEHLTSARE